MMSRMAPISEIINAGIHSTQVASICSKKETSKTLFALEEGLVTRDLVETYSTASLQVLDVKVAASLILKTDIVNLWNYMRSPKVR